MEKQADKMNLKIHLIVMRVHINTIYMSIRL